MVSRRLAKGNRAVGLAIGVRTVSPTSTDGCLMARRRGLRLDGLGDGGEGGRSLGSYHHGVKTVREGAAGRLA